MPLCFTLTGLGCELVLGDFPPVKQGIDAGVGGTGGATSTTLGTGGATTTSSSGGGGACCDCDGDGVPAQGPCGGTDCHDHDKRAHPGESVYYGFPTSDPNVGFDWDCSGAAEPNPMLAVVVDCPPVGLPCPPGIGFLDKTPPACGESKAWGSCNQDGFSCVKAVIEDNKVMTCK